MDKIAAYEMLLENHPLWAKEAANSSAGVAKGSAGKVLAPLHKSRTFGSLVGGAGLGLAGYGAYKYLTRDKDK